LLSLRGFREEFRKEVFATPQPLMMPRGGVENLLFYHVYEGVLFCIALSIMTLFGGLEAIIYSHVLCFLLGFNYFMEMPQMKAIFKQKWVMEYLLLSIFLGKTCL